MRLLSPLLFAIAVAAAAPSAAFAQAPYHTNADYVACLTLDAFNEQGEILASGDQSAWTAYIADRSNGCVFLRAGIPVYVGYAKGLGIIKIRPAGKTLWLYTASEAVSR